jgi:hypothetical protein
MCLTNARVARRRRLLGHAGNMSGRTALDTVTLTRHLTVRRVTLESEYVADVCW